MFPEPWLGPPRVSTGTIKVNIFATVNISELTKSAQNQVAMSREITKKTEN